MQGGAHLSLGQGVRPAASWSRRARAAAAPDRSTGSASLRRQPISGWTMVLNLGGSVPPATAVPARQPAQQRNFVVHCCRGQPGSVLSTEVRCHRQTE